MNFKDLLQINCAFYNPSLIAVVPNVQNDNNYNDTQSNYNTNDVYIFTAHQQTL